jgi:hypothetical protein
MVPYPVVLWIRIGLNAHPAPDQAFYLKADPDSDPWSQIKADQNPGKIGRSVDKFY